MATNNPGFGTEPATLAELTHDYAGTTGATPYPDSDAILFQNTSGQAAIWQTDAAGIQSENTLGPNPGTGWDALLSGGFGMNGAGIDNAATVFQSDTTGAIQIWTTNTNVNAGAGVPIVTSQLNVVNAAGVAEVPGTNWQLAGLGEFNGVSSDGNTGVPTGGPAGAPDLLFQNSQTGALAEWYINQSATGLAVATPVTFMANNTDPTWHVVGTNDFQAQSAATGQAGVDGNTITTTAATGEQYDIWFQNSVTGQVAGWHVGGQDASGNPVVTQFADLANPGPNWQLVSTDGYFGGTTVGGDLLFQNTVTGNIGVWQMNDIDTGGLTTSAVANMSSLTVGGAQNTDPTWVLLGAGDYSGHSGLTNTSIDLLFQNSSTGAVAIWVGNDSAAFAAGANHLLANPGTTWSATHVQDALLNA